MSLNLPSIGRTREAQRGLIVVAETVLRARRDGGLGWLFRELPALDFGVDGHIELIEDGAAPRATGKLLAVQVKCGASYFAHDEGDSWSVYVKQSTVAYWRSYSIPVLLVLVDPSSGLAYWARGDDEELEEKQESFRVRVLKSQRLGSGSHDELAELAHDSSPRDQALARLEADAPLLSAAVAGEQVVIVIDHWYNKSSGRVDYWLGVPGINPSPAGPRDIVPFTNGSGIGSGGDPFYVAAHVAPWASPELDEDRENELEEDLYDEYLAETGAWDSEDEIYIDVLGEYAEWLAKRRAQTEDGPIGEDLLGEVTRYRLQLAPKPEASAYLTLRNLLAGGRAAPIAAWPPKGER